MTLALILIILGVVGFFAYRHLTSSTKPGLPAEPLRSTSPPIQNAQALTWPNRDEFECEVVGESHYQDNIARALKLWQKHMGDVPLIALLTPEANNKHDRNAVSVTIGGAMVGYLERDFAPIYRERLIAEGMGLVPVHCQAMITGGHELADGSKASYGVVLDIEAPEEFEELEEN
jgi:hypothetical protein